ncbi:MAG: hypothetical protein ACOC7V_11545 [Spirochaetota bacterium]
MRRHYLLTVLRLPGNVEAGLVRLQRLIFAWSGAVSSQAFPPAVPLAGCALGGDALAEAPHRTTNGGFLPARLAAPLALEGPQARGRTLCMETGLSVGSEPPHDFPTGVDDARLRVFLATVPGGEAGACQGEPVAAAVDGGAQELAERLQEAWTRDSETGTMTVRRVWEERWLVSVEGEPWWCSLDWRVTDRRALRSART